MGYDNTHAISRTPQKETANGIASHNNRNLKRNPQTLLKEQQKQKEAFANAKENKQQSHLDRLRKEGINSPMLKDVLNEGNEDLSKRAPILQGKKDESARTDQKNMLNSFLNSQIISNKLTMHHYNLKMKLLLIEHQSYKRMKKIQNVLIRKHMFMKNKIRILKQISNKILKSRKMILFQRVSL